jgi:DNA-binding CsgD family transcriptional regulator
MASTGQRAAEEQRSGSASAPADLVERERELADLSRLVEATIAGEGRMALIEGRAGVGKTRLLVEARRLAEGSGVTVLSARAGQLERDFPFGVVRQLFEPRLHGEDRDVRFAGAAAAAREVFEDLREVEQSLGASYATLHGLFWLLLDLSEERPLVIAVDDLQWCDPSSLRFLGFLVRRLDGLPILLAATMRSAEPGTDAALLSELAHDPFTETIEPGPVSEDAAREMAAALLGPQADARFASACHEATGGNPLLLKELLTALRAEKVEPVGAQAALVREVGRRSVTGSVQIRLSRLPADAVAVARACAVLGEGATVIQVAGLTGLDERAVVAATEELTRAEILRPELPLGFVHPLVLDGVYGELSAGERELEHGRAAELLREAGASPDIVAKQLLATPPRGNPDVARLLQEAGRAAQRKGAADSAVTYLSRALAEGPDPERRPQILFELGLAEALTNGPASVEHLLAAYEAQTEPVPKAVAAHVACRVLTFMASPREAAELARQTAELLPPELADLRQSFEVFEMVATILFGAGDVTSSDWRADRERLLAEGVGPGVGEKMLAATVAMFSANSDGDAESCSKLALEALEDNLLIAADNGYMDILPMFVLAIADREEALEAADAILAEAQRRGSSFAVAALHGWRGFVLFYRGDLVGAEEAQRAGFEELQTWGISKTAGYYAGGFLGSTLIERGDLAGARELLEETGVPDDSSDGARFWRNAMMWLLLAEGSNEAALTAAEEFAELHSTVQNPATAWWRSVKAEALRRLGREEEGIALLEEQLELARRWGAPGTVGLALRELGAARQDEQGLAELEEAVAVLDGSPARLELAEALCALGTALRHARRPADARDPLRRALELATACGAEPLAERARAELNAAGGRARREALSGVDSLTPSERRVAAMAAEGMTNREIAQSLFVTPKTVEVHLSSAYRKLGISSRRQLAAVLPG